MGYVAVISDERAKSVLKNVHSCKNDLQVYHGPWRSKTGFNVPLRSFWYLLDVHGSNRPEVISGWNLEQHAHFQNRTVRSVRYKSTWGVFVLSVHVWGSRYCVHVGVGHVVVTSYRVLKVSCSFSVNRYFHVFWFFVLIKELSVTQKVCSFSGAEIRISRNV